MRFAAASSTHPVPALATGEAIGQVLEQVGVHPDVVFVFVTPGHAGALEDMGGAVRSILQPTVLVGAVGRGVLGADLSTPGPGMVLFAARTGPAIPLRWSRSGTDAETDSPLPSRGVVVAFGHPGVPVAHPDLVHGGPVVGGRVAHRPLLLDDLLVGDGAVGVAFPPDLPVRVSVDEGVRPIGTPLVVTSATGSALHQIAGQPAYDCLIQIARDQVPASDIALINRGLYLTTAPGAGTPGPVRSSCIEVLGSDSGTGALALGGSVEEGAFVQFCVRDPASAEHRLRAAVAQSDAWAALLFPRAYPTGDPPDLLPGGGPGHDARAIAGLFTTASLAAPSDDAGDCPGGASAIIFGERGTDP